MRRGFGDFIMLAVTVVSASLWMLVKNLFVKVCPRCGGLRKMNSPTAGVLVTCPRCAGKGVVSRRS